MPQRFSFLILLLCFGFLHFSKAQITLVEWNFPYNPDDSIADIASSIPNNAQKKLTVFGGVNPPAYGTVPGINTYAASATYWHHGVGTKGWEIEFSTLGCYNVDVSSKQVSPTNGPRDFKVQYKVGAGGAFIDLPGATAITLNSSLSAPTGIINFIPLPAICENQPSVYLRWVMASDISVSGASIFSTAISRIDEIVVNANSNGYYRTINSGKWRDKTIWEYSPDNINWMPADTSPTYAAKTISIRNGHTVVIDATNYAFQNCNYMIDEVYINVGGQLNINDGYVFFNNGPLTDINVDGTLMDSLNSGPSPFTLGYINWNAGSTWKLGSTGTFIKTRGSTNAFYQSNYQGGIITIPATANWILRKTSAVNPSMLTAGMYYPNFIMENATATLYNANTVGSNFSGTSICTIYGNMLINAGATNPISMQNNITLASLLLKGNLVINTNGTLTHFGDNITIEGDLTINGSLSYGASNQRKITLAGANSQTINTASGSLSVYNLEINKSANDVTVNKSFTVDNNLNFLQGRFFTGVSVITFGINATASNFNNTSFVHGPCNKIGTAAFTFPIGKGYNVQPIGVNASASSDTYSAEYFYTDPHVFGTNLAPTLDHISFCEYWNLNQLSGTSSRQVDLTWDNFSCGVTSLLDLRVARFNIATATWLDHGNSATTGNNTAGAITSSLASTIYGTYTLASINGLNPLPVEYLSFDVKRKDQNALITWTTSSEPNNDYFVLEKTPNLVELTQLAVIDAKGNSLSGNSYSFKDPLPTIGLSYYRIKQVDNNGNFKYTSWKSLKMDNCLQQLNVVADDAGISFSLTPSSVQTANLKLYNNSGLLIYKSVVMLRSVNQFNPGRLAHGIYYLSIEIEGIRHCKKFSY